MRLALPCLRRCELAGLACNLSFIGRGPCRYTCADTVTGLAKGYEGLPLNPTAQGDEHTRAEQQQQLELASQVRQAGAASAADPKAAAAAASDDAAAMQQVQGAAELEWARLLEKEAVAAAAVEQRQAF